MKFDESVVNKIELIDRVLARVGAKNVVDNPLFQQNQARAYEDYVEYSVNSNESVSFNIIISRDGLQLGVDDMTEIFEWSQRQFIECRNEIVDTLEMIFTSAVEIERCGRRYRVIRFLNAQGNVVHTCKYISGLFFPFFCKTEPYRPLLRSEPVAAG